MPLTVDDLILARATAMAEHDGTVVSAVFILGAASQLQADIITARDRLLNVAAGSEHTGAGEAAALPDELEADQDEAPEEEPVIAVDDKQAPAVAEPAAETDETA
jgi:hypothetical protein